MYFSFKRVLLCLVKKLLAASTDELLLTHMPNQENITQLLLELSNGNHSTLDDLLPLVYDELKRMAASYLRRERADHTLQPTALVNEA